MPLGLQSPWGLINVGASSAGGTSLPPGQVSPLVLTNGSGSPITLGMLCYVSGNDIVQPAISNGTLAQASVAYMCLDATIASAATGRFVYGGIVTGLTGGVFNTLGYLGTTAGLISATPDLVAGHYNQISGLWLSATQFAFNPTLPIQN